MSMSIRTAPGSRIVFIHPKAGYPYDQQKAWKFLREGAEYTVERVVAGDDITHVWLKEIPTERFNSVHFDNVPGSDRLFPDNPEHGLARRTDPETSHDAAQKVNASDLEKVFLFWLAKYPDGLTAKDVAKFSNEPLNSISPRMAPLRKKNLIYDSGERRDGSIIWKLR